MSNQNLSEYSKSYFQESEIYKEFSDAEDFPDLAFNFILPIIKNKIVLDLGCGNGKYSKKIQPFAKSIYAIDQSFAQIKQLSHIKNQAIQANAAKIPLSSSSIEIVFSSWMLGTILDLNKRQDILEECKRVLIPNCKIILLENAENSEFELIRGKNLDNKTQEYNQWLFEKGFKVINTIQTYFKFSSAQKATSLFHSIWGESLKKKDIPKIVKHKILVLEYISN